MQSKHSNFSYLWLSFLISSVGDWLYKLAIPIIILNKTGSAYHAAATFGVSFVPWVFFSLLGGSLADNYDKKKILISGNLFATLVCLMLLEILSAQESNFSLLYAAILLLASVDPLIHPSFQSIIPELVRPEKFASANAIIQTIDNTLSILGPLLGGSIVTMLGGRTALWLDLFSFMIASLALLGLPRQKKTHPKKGAGIFLQLMNDIVEGAKYSFQQKVIFSGSLMFLFTNFALNMFEANFIFYMTKSLHYPVLDATFAMSLGGCGALAAGLVGDKIVARFRAGFLLSNSTILAGLSTLLLLLNTNYIYIGVILGLISFFGNINVITYFTLRQRTIPKKLLGRVVSVTLMISYASIPVGSWLGGSLLEHGQPMFTVILLAGSIRTLAGIGAKLSPLGKEK
ncbi:major facilitator superfamily transporter [Ligilactobacillus salitolerans]|uniref:Major facilitator superfamily transporter n=1 Tax=Ligilactobacillus salitolerans TaxID=1808352 RepID=A0A401IRY9_9LACO|nr:MFS transporter [Ligilactobacillus salitolerans]GBG94299.1 major facilitator superfamily transporter [Ligilactobacillus salitolerans]